MVYKLVLLRHGESDWNAKNLFTGWVDVPLSEKGVEEARRGRIKGRGIDEESFARHLYDPDMPDVDLFIRSSGEQRTSNFLLWQSAYAEMVFLDTLWPDFDRRHLWQAIEIYAQRDRRYGGAIDQAATSAGQNPATGLGRDNAD